MDKQSYIKSIFTLKNEQLTQAERKTAVDKLESDILADEEPNAATKCGLIQTLYSATGLMPWKWNEKQVVIAGIRHKCGMPIHDSMKVALGLISASTPDVDAANAELATA